MMAPLQRPDAAVVSEIAAAHYSHVKGFRRAQKDWCCCRFEL